MVASTVERPRVGSIGRVIVVNARLPGDHCAAWVWRAVALRSASGGNRAVVSRAEEPSAVVRAECRLRWYGASAWEGSKPAMSL